MAGEKRLVPYRFQPIRQRNFAQTRIKKCPVFDVLQRGRQADGPHTRITERVLVDLRHALRDHDLCFQAIPSSKFRKRVRFNFGQSGGKLQTGKALAAIKRAFPHRFDAVRQGQGSDEAVAIHKCVLADARHAVRDQQFAGKVSK